MGCVCSRGKGEEINALSFSDQPAEDRFAGIRKNAYGSYDSGELRIKQPKAGAGKVAAFSSSLIC